MRESSVASGGVVAFDLLSAAEAASLMQSCCGATAWVQEMVIRRPFRALNRLFDAAEDVWWSLTPADWLEAFAHHPRIGEQSAAVRQGATAHAWSRDEQRGASSASDATRDALAQGNRDYEAKFGYIYLVCATGKSAEELLTILRDRLANDAGTELRIAAIEQAKITRLRLEKLFTATRSTTDA